MVEGTSKLQSELQYAYSIPQKERRLIHKSLLEAEQWNNYGYGYNPEKEGEGKDEVIAENYDRHNSYFK